LASTRRPAKCSRGSRLATAEEEEEEEEEEEKEED
jgi:hypothetical protein